MKKAIIGIGSNSTRLLVAEMEGSAITPVLRKREDSRLFSGICDGKLTEKAMLACADGCARLAHRAREAGAQTLDIIATEATREADNGEEFLALISDLCDAKARAISGDEEARLSFLAVSQGSFSGMIDIGGGSVELCLGAGGRPFSTGSAKLGARRLLEELGDISAAGYDRALALCEQRMEALLAEMNVIQLPAAFYAVGGTATCLASIEMGLAQYDRSKTEGFALEIDAAQRWAKKLSEMSYAERESLRGSLPNRADILPYGAIALLAAMRAVKAERVIVSEKTNLDGFLRDMAQNAEDFDPAGIVRGYYDASVEKEWERLERNVFEFEINRRYIERYVKRGDKVLDVGGGPGRYSLHLAKLGMEVTLADLSPENVAFALDKAKEQGLSLSGFAADVREITKHTEGPYDAVLLMGPLYHLLREEDRVKAVNECLALLKPGGVLVVAFISMVGGMVYAAREMPESILWENEDIFYEKVLAGEDFAGAAFTQAFMIDPKHVEPFMEKFPLEKLHMVNSEGFTAPFRNNITESSPEAQAKWLAVSLALCEREEFFTYAEHFLYIARKKGE